MSPVTGSIPLASGNSANRLWATSVVEVWCCVSRDGAICFSFDRFCSMVAMEL